MTNAQKANHMRLSGSVNSKLDRLNKADGTHNYEIHVEDGPYGLNVFACKNCKLTLWESYIPTIELDGNSTNDYVCEEPIAMARERAINKRKEYYEERKALGDENPMSYEAFHSKKKYREWLGTCTCDPVHVC